jgi:c-di-GMP-binding flagellar brake protein YcgR
MARKTPRIIAATTNATYRTTVTRHIASKDVTVLIYLINAPVETNRAFFQPRRNFSRININTVSGSLPVPIGAHFEYSKYN